MDNLAEVLRLLILNLCYGLDDLVVLGLFIGKVSYRLVKGQYPVIVGIFKVAEVFRLMFLDGLDCLLSYRRSFLYRARQRESVSNRLVSRVARVCVVTSPTSRGGRRRPLNYYNE